MVVLYDVLAHQGAVGFGRARVVRARCPAAVLRRLRRLRVALGETSMSGGVLGWWGGDGHERRLRGALVRADGAGVRARVERGDRGLGVRVAARAGFLFDDGWCGQVQWS